MAKRPPKNREREDRIQDEIIVDAYNEEEQAMSWYYHLEGKLTFPFQAKQAKAIASSPLRAGEVVRVTAMAVDEDCRDFIRVLVKFDGRACAIRLDFLTPILPDAQIGEAMEDWKYYVNQSGGVPF
jgi:hypothetical protein